MFLLTSNPIPQGTALNNVYVLSLNLIAELIPKSVCSFLLIKDCTSGCPLFSFFFFCLILFIFSWFLSYLFLFLRIWKVYKNFKFAFGIGILSNSHTTHPKGPVYGYICVSYEVNIFQFDVFWGQVLYSDA